MKKCVIIVNKMSGNGSHVRDDRLKYVFGGGFEVDIVHLIKRTVLEDFSSYDRIVICGGDGTLNGIINCKKKPGVELIYCPYGTLNELATGNARERDYVLHDIGAANDKRFAYVCAAGTFTPLGYVVKDKHKRAFKGFAYIGKVLGQYKLCRINANMSIDGKIEEGDYTLIMAIDSPKCFGFKFNKMYRLDDGLLHLLTIRTPVRDGLLGAIKVFFPLFRAFFIGFDKPYRSKNMLFAPFSHLNIVLREKVDFCMDGERVPLKGEIDIHPVQFDVPIRIVSIHAIDEYFKQERHI